MAKTPGKVSEADLLADDDEQGAGLDLGADDDNSNLDDLGDLDSAPGEQSNGAERHLDAGDDIEVEILESDEGVDKTLEADDDVSDIRGREQDVEDTGEELGDDLLSADERKGYSKSVQKRIMRERRLKRESDAQAAAERTARVRAEAALIAHRKVSAGLLLRVLDGDIASKTTELLKAKEEGKSEDEIKLQGELDDLRAKKREVSATKEALDRMAAPKGGPARGAENPMLTRWKGRNAWFESSQFATQAKFVRSIDSTLAEEFNAGTFRHPPNSQEWFNEIDRRLHREVPTLKTRIRQAYGGGGEQARARVAPVARSASRPMNSGGKVTLTKDDLFNMSTFGLDPKNKVHLREYALQKRGAVNG